MVPETLVPFDTAAEAVAIVESWTSGVTMASGTPVPIAASTDAVVIVLSRTSLTRELVKSTIGYRVVLSTGGTTASEKFVPVAAAAATCV